MQIIDVNDPSLRACTLPGRVIVSTDIDIDFPNRDAALAGVWHVPAVQMRQGERVKHLSGVYFQNIPIDPTDDWAVYNHEEAAKRGYFKIDFLSSNIYQGVRDDAHLDELLAREPLWELFEEHEIVRHLAQINNHFSTVQTIKPKSIGDLAVCLALMRPGKRHLIGRPRTEIDAEIWQPTEAYYYKKPHAIAFAASIVVQLNLLVE